MYPRASKYLSGVCVDVSVRTSSVLHLSACVLSASERRAVDTHGSFGEMCLFKTRAFAEIYRFFFTFFFFLAYFPYSSSSLSKQESKLLPKDLAARFV